MNYYLVTWFASALSGEMHQIQLVVKASTPKEAVLNYLVQLGCLAKETTIDDVLQGKVSIVNNDKPNGFEYGPHLTSNGINALELKEIDVETDDEVIKVLILKNEKERSYYKWDCVGRPFLSTIKWTSFGDNHDIIDKHDIKVIGYGPNLHHASINVMTALILDINYAFNHEQAEQDLDKENYCYSTANSKYELTKTEVMQRYEANIDGEVKNIMFSKNHCSKDTPPLAWVLSN